MSYFLHLLGDPRLETSEVVIPLERRPASILAYLALEGSTPKYKLAGLLWPDSGETAARSNMRQILRRMRVAGLELITGDDHIALRENVSTDVSQLSSLDLQRVLEVRESGELLEGLDFDDAPDFAEWLESVRHELKNLRYRALETEADRLETEEQFSQALEVSQRLIRLEPLAEDAHRRVMRLYYLAGDRGAALAAFEHCKKILQEEVGVTPMSETIKLAKEIEQGINLPKQTSVVKTVPLNMLRPPSLVGREKEWEQLETAWNQGQLIFIEGAPGVGKTRLVQEFVAGKKHLWLEGRPGDIAVPYSSASRMYRRVLELRPELKLEPWVRRELARLVPELGDLPEPISSEEDKLRFFEAALLTFSQTTRGLEAVVIDDLQFFDAASIRLGNYTLSKSYPLGQDIPRHLALYRQGELDADAQAVVDSLVASGVAALIKIEPLSTEAIQDLLAHLELKDAKDLAPSLSRYTGGNPLFMLETIRHLHQTGQLEKGWPGRLPPPGKVGPLVQRRLERLSEVALQVAQAAAVLKSDFTFELICEVLGKSPLELTKPWRELEDTQVMTGERFSHDLIFEAVQAHTPEAVKRWLNRAAAECLERKSANPARIAQHWLEGGADSKAAQWFITAAQQRYSGMETANLYAQAATIFEVQGEVDKAFEARLAQAKALRDVDLGMAVEELITKLFALASTSTQRTQVNLVKGEWLRLVGRFDEVTDVLHRALEEASQSKDAGLESLVLERISASLWEQGKQNEMLEFLNQAHVKAQLSQQPEVMLLTERMLFVVHQSRGDWAAAEPHYQRGLELAKQVGDYNSLSLLLSRASLHQIAVGDTEATLRLAKQAWQLHEEHQGSGEYHQLAALVLWAAHQMRGEPFVAIQPLQAVVREYEGQSYNITGVVHAALSSTYSYLGNLEQALLHYRCAKEWPGYPPFARHMLHMAEARLVQHARLPLPEKIAPYEGLALPEMNIALVSWAKVLPPEQAFPLLHYLLELNVYRLPASLIETHIRLAQKLLELGRKEEALEAIRDDLETIKTVHTIIVDRAEVHYTHYCVLAAFRKPEALESLKVAHAWIMKVAESLPEEDRKIFLSVNPVCRAILEAATQHGLA